MPVSIPPTPASTSAPSTSTHLSTTTKPAKRPVPRDHVFNYTYTYGYNFGYIANGFALIPASKTEQEKQQGEGPVPLTVPATTPRTADPATKFSLTFSSGASEKRGKAPTVLLHPSTSVHPFSPYYGAYIELVASGGFSGTDKEERGSEGTAIDTRGGSSASKQQEERKRNKRKRAEGAMDEEMEYFLMPSHGKKTKVDEDGLTSPASASASTSWLSPLSASTSTNTASSSTSTGISLTFQDGSRMTRSPSPADSLRSFGSGMMGMERPRTPGGVFTSGTKKGKGQAAKPRPRGLWRARGTGPLPSVLNMNGVPMTGGALLSGISNKGKMKAAPMSDKTTHTTREQGKGSGSRPRHRRHRETDDYCSSESESSEMSSDGSESSGEGLKNLKRRRVRRGRSRGEEGDVYSDSGSSVSSADATCSSGSDRDNDDDDEQQRRLRGPKRARRHGQGGTDHHHHRDGRRHRDHTQADQIQQAQHKQSRKTLLSASTMGTAATPIPPLDDPADPRYVTRSKVMDTTSLARTRASPDAERPSNQVTYSDWEDLKEVWARCLEVVDVEDPSEMVPLLRGIIHECSRFLQAYEDPSVLFIPSHPGNNVERKNSDPSLPTKIDSGIGTDPQPPIDASPALSTQSQPQKPQHVHSKDTPTAFHAILGTALFFFGNLIAASPHLALEGEPKSRAFYHLYVLDVFEMAECMPVRTGMGGVPLTDNECCGLKEDWRMAIVWGRALVSITEELLEREQMSEEIMEARAADEKGKEPENYFSYPRHEFLVPSSRGGPPQPNPASFLSEDFVINSGMLGDGYFVGTGGRGMGFSVDGMGGLRVAGNYGMPEQTLQLPSVVFPLTNASVRGERTPSGGASPTPGVSSPFSTLSLGEASSSSTTPGSSTLSTVSGRPATSQARFPYPALSPHTPADDPRRHWKKDSPFVVIRSRMPPVTRRMTLTDAGTSGPGGLLPSPAPITGTAFTTSWWNDDYEDNGRYQGGSLSGESGLPIGKGKAKQKERNKKKHAGPSVDEILTMAVDQFSRGILHMPRTGSLVSSGGVVLDGGKREGHRHHRHKHGHGHKHHSHHHHHHRRHRHTDTDEADVAAAAGTPPPFSRASHLLTIAMEVLMLAEKLPSAESRYRWASYADNVFEQMRLEESPGVNIIARSGGSDDEEMDVDDDVDGSVGDGGEGRPSRGRSSKHGHRHGSHSKSYSFSRNTSEADPTHLDSGNNDVILKARGRCALIIGSAISEESVEVWLEELEGDDDGQGESTPDANKTPAPGFALPDASSRSERAKAKKKEIEAVLMSEDAEEARGRLRQAVEFFEKARGVWREGVALRRKERERVKERIERDKARASPVSDKKDKGKGRFRIGSPPVKRRGIGALAAENKKRRREAAVKEKEKQMVGVPVDEDAMMDVDVEMGGVGVERRDSGSTAPATPSAIQVESPSGSAQDVSVQAEDEDERLLALFAAEEEEEEAEEREYGRLIAETVVTLANILLVDEGDVESEDVSGVEKATEKEREELYLKAKEEMRRGGIEEADDMI